MEGPVRSSVLSRMLSRGGAATSAPSPGSSTHASELTCNPYSSNSPTREPDAERSSYLRVKIDGEEGDADFAKCAAIIAKTILARQSYKSIDKGQAEELMHEEQLQEMPLNAPKDMTADTPLQHTKQRRRSTQLPGHEEPLDLTAAPSDGDDDDDDTTNHDADETRASMMEEGEEEGGSATKFSSSSTNGGKVGGRRGLHITYQEGVYRVTDMRTSIIPWEQYVKDICLVYAAIENGPCLSTARARLTSMAEKFQLYLLLNTEVESSYDASSKGGGVYARGTKVDNGLNMKTNVSASTFLDFVVRTATEAPRTPLYTSKTGKTVTLMGYLEAAGIHSPEELTVEGLGLHPSLFRNKYIPHDVYDRHLNRAGTVGQRLMQAVFATHGPNNGDLCGALIRSELEQREFRQKQIITTEMTLEVYGHHPDEVERLAAWVHRQGFNNFKRNMWSIMIPRRAPPDGPNTLENKVVTVGDQLRHIFLPLMMATLYPADRKWAPVAQLLRQTGSLCIHTEPVIRTENLSPHPINPDNIAITPDKVCSDYYFFYYVWANLASLNALRRRLGLNTIQFSPFVLEPTSAFDQLVAGFLLGDVVHHVTSLRKSWIMQYLYMMCRIGIVLSPLRDNALHTPYFEHPITTYFRQGMRVSMATSDPLYFHHRSEQPLVEEYATLMKVHNLQPMDLCELARNSVLNSNFPLELKREWLGEHFSPLGSSGNDVSRSSVCNHRLDFRHESLLEEETLLNLVLATAAKQGETPMVVGNIPIAASLQLPEVVAQSRRQRRINYTDRRIVYPRIDVYGLDSTHIRAKESVETLRHVMALRNKYTNTRVVDVCVEDVFAHASDFEEDMYEYNSYYGVCLLSRVGTSPEWPAFIPPVQDFIHDVNTVRRAVSSRELTKLAVHRLHVLERKFLLHISINISNEAGKQADKEWNNRDYLTAHKVDTNVRIDAGHNARTLLEFFVDKVLNHGEDVVFEEDNQPITLRQLLRRYDINVSQITVDELNHQIDAHPDLRRIFLSPFNFMQGRYFAELTKRTLTLYQEDAYNFAENRLALQGESEQEWVELAHWFDRYGMASSQSRWMVSFPRSYRRLKQQGVVRDFGQFLDNLFRPLWEISLHPARDTKFHYFLAHVSGFDCYDDETWFDVPLSVMYPHDWRSQQNPPYNLYLYYMWANITSLNEFRASRGLGTFTFRPQCGEHGGVDHLIGGFLLCNGISHGVTLAKHPVMEYMYYLTQLGVAMSPLSNTASACAYLENPFPIFFHRGLNVSLGTNQPLYFHFTREPLVEEYSIAAKLWRFEFNDLSEIARNSVLQSGFPPSWKHKALGPLYQLHSTLGNDVRRSRVSDIRVAYRYEVYHTELNYLDAQLSTTHRMPRAMTLLEEELAQYEAALRNRCVAELIATSVPANKDAVEEARLRKEKEAEANISLESRCATARSDIATLEQEIHRIQALSTQARTQNVQMAMAINRIRTYLQNERFSILGNLGENAAESTAAASPLSPREMTRKLNNSSGENSVTGRGFLSAPGTARHSSVVVGGGGDADEKGSSVGDEDERVLELSKTSGYEGKEGGALRVPDLAHAARTNSSSNASHPLQLEEEDEEGDDDDGVAKEEEEDEERNGSSSTGSQVGVVVGELTHQGYPDIVEEEVEAATADDAAPATTSSAIHEDVVADDGEKKCDQNDGDAVVEMGSAHTAGSADDEPQEVPDCEEEAAQMNRDVDGSAPLQQHSSSNHSNSNSNSAVVKSNASLPASDAHDQQPTSPPKEVENVADEPSNNHHENGEEEEQQHVEEMPTSTPSE